MQATLNTGYAVVEISRELVTVRVVGSRRKITVFDGRDNGERLEYTERAVKAVLASDGFDDDICCRLRQLLAEPDAVVVERIVQNPLNYY